MDVGAVIPPQGCIRRERPSTPSAHMARAVRLSPRTALLFGALHYLAPAESVRLRTSRQSRGVLLDNKSLFHNIFVSHVVDSFALGLASVFLPHGLVHDTSKRRGA